MKRGLLTYAHNNEKTNYLLMALGSAKLAKDNLGYPVSLVTDSKSLESLTNTKYQTLLDQVFESIVLTDDVVATNKRKSLVTGEQTSFLNLNRDSAYDLTPYDQTLLFDSDFLIFTKELNRYWDVDQSFLISSAVDFFDPEVKGILDYRVSPTSLDLKWATTIFFKKDAESKAIFDLVKFIKNNYFYFGSIYKFDTKQFRNDIAFTVALHIIDGFKKNVKYELPPIKTIHEAVIVQEFNKNSLLKFLLPKTDKIYPIKIKDTDLHFMNKQFLIDNIDTILEL